MELGLCNTWSFRDPSHCTKTKLAKYRQLHSTARWGTHVLCGPLEKNQGINCPISKAGTGTKPDISALKRDEKQVPTLLPNRGQWNKSQESQVYLKLNWAQSPMWHSSEPTAINNPSPLTALTSSGLLTTKGWKRFLRVSVGSCWATLSSGAASFARRPAGHRGTGSKQPGGLGNAGAVAPPRGSAASSPPSSVPDGAAYLSRRTASA